MSADIIRCALVALNGIQCDRAAVVDERVGDQPDVKPATEEKPVNSNAPAALQGENDV